MGLKCNLFVLFVIIGLTSAASSANDILSEQKGNAKAKCESSYSLMCLKLDVLSLIDKISTTNTEFNLASGVTLVRENNPNKTQNSKIVSELARAFPDSPEKRLNGFLLAKIQDFLQSYSLKLKLGSEETSSVFESRKGGGGKKGGGYGALIGMAMMMKGAMMAMGLGAVAALAGKALLTAMMALTLAAIAGLKSLGGGGGKSTTYEIISKPVYSHSHSHSQSSHGGHGGSHEEGHGGGYGGYGRSFPVNFELPESVKA
ncbi:CLUMA_CG000852, isoform A [Clunio marinus]|uniref:CLUMA_CG000852, isoform A n=1 Tax=Clunio marinus TaxID=568069 RepID=A0A1J1HGV4_9DIPT|nr:CLUMA_CG000852, isoform A [Clunio marinus]